MKIQKVVLIFLFMSSLSYGKEFSYPDIDFRYAGIFDTICWGEKYPQEATKWITETYQTIPKFKEAWEKNGMPLLKSTIKFFGKEFKRKEMIASIFLCNKYPSIGTPLLVKAGWFLKSPMNGKPLKMELFVSNVFHELLHTYLEENFSQKLLASKTALKYLKNKKSRTTITHLHLMAVMKKVYIDNRSEKLLKEVIEFEGRFAPDYKVAWDIVNKEYENLISELK